MHSSLYQNSCIFNPRFDINSRVISRYKLSVPRREINLGFREERQDFYQEDWGFLCQCPDTSPAPPYGEGIPGRASMRAKPREKTQKRAFWFKKCFASQLCRGGGTETERSGGNVRQPSSSSASTPQLYLRLFYEFVSQVTIYLKEGPNAQFINYWIIGYIKEITPIK